MRSRLVPAMLGVALAGRLAHADAVTDFKNGTTLLLRTGTVAIGVATRSSAGVPIAKSSGTLDFTIDASNLGMPLPATIHLHGSSLGGGAITYTFDENYSPTIDLGDGHTLSRLTGQLNAYIAWLPGTAPQSNGNVRLRLTGAASSVVAYGDWGTQTIGVDDFDVIGGIAQPALEAFVDNGDHLMCSDTVETTQPLAVWLASAARGGGATVEIASPISGGVDVPRQVVVSAGRRSANITAHIEPSFVGTVHLTASASGVTRSLDVVVHDRSDCVAGPASTPSITKWVPDGIAGCASCTAYVDVNDSIERLTTINGRIAVVRGKQVFDLLKTFSTATAVGADTMNDDGTIAGRITIGGVTQAYRANLNHSTPTPFLLGTMTPEGINNFDLVVGFHVVNGASQAVYSSGHGVVPFSLTSAFGIVASRALAVSDGDHVMGTYTDSSGIVRGFRWFNGVTTTLPTLGTKPVLPVAIDDSGQIAGNGANSAGQPLAAIVSPTGALTALGVPSGYVTFEARSMNRFGAVVGVATILGATVVQRAFVWRPGHGFTALTNYVANLTATDAVRITDANQVVVNGTYNGVTDLYLLTL